MKSWSRDGRIDSARRLRSGRSSLETIHWTVSFAFGKSLLTTVDASALNADGVLKLSSGKKKHVLVKPA
jgi:hypothetical protein